MDVWANFSSGIAQYATDAFSVLDPWFYPIIFIGVIGYIYTCMHSVTVAVVAIIITLGLFGATTSIFAGVPEVTQLLYIISIIGITMLIVTLILKRRVVM